MGGTGTFVLALLGVVLSSAGLVWNFVNFLLTGPRISVALTLGVANDAGDQMRSWSIPADRADLTDEIADVDATREVVVISVRNSGRAPVNVDRAGVAVGKSKWFHHDITVAGIDGGGSRLEPGAASNWRTDVWPLVDLLRSRRKEDVLLVRAYAQLGSGRHVRSPRKKAWVIDRSVTSVVPGRPAGWEPPNRSGPGDEPNYFTAEYSGWQVRFD